MSGRRDTLETRSRNDRRYAASVEETEDEEALEARKKPTLPTNGRYTIMSESEAVNHSEKGEVEPDRPTRNTESTESAEKQENRAWLLFDRPKPPPKPEWLGHPQLPVELNEVILAMWPYNDHRRSTEHNEYRESQTSEISETVEFMLYIQPNEPT